VRWLRARRTAPRSDGWYDCGEAGSPSRTSFERVAGLVDLRIVVLDADVKGWFEIRGGRLNSRFGRSWSPPNLGCVPYEPALCSSVRASNGDPPNLKGNPRDLPGVSWSSRAAGMPEEPVA
jgi:hypothetical protein